MWECGLKPAVANRPLLSLLSLPMWECGLKQKVDGSIREAYVTPHVGVWIETDCYRPVALFYRSLPMWECGLKLLSLLAQWLALRSLPMWECGLKR